METVRNLGQILFHTHDQSSNEKSQSSCIGCKGSAVIAALGVTYAYNYSSQITVFCAGALFGFSLAHLANRFFTGKAEASAIPHTDLENFRVATSPIIKEKFIHPQPEPIFDNIGSSTVDQIRASCLELIADPEFPRAHYCFQLWGATRKDINASNILQKFKSLIENFDESLPVILIVLRESRREKVESVKYPPQEMQALAAQGIKGLAFFNISNNKFITGEGFDENKAAIIEACQNFQTR